MTCSAKSACRVAVVSLIAKNAHEIDIHSPGTIQAVATLQQASYELT